MKNPGEVGGLLYLENRLVHGAFILRRLPLLEFLAALSLRRTPCSAASWSRRR